MKPILFDETANNFTTNGVGRLSDAISCKVTEERNGQYELDMTYPETGLHAKDIAISAIIGVIPSDGATLQPFRIYKITKPINGKFNIYAQHISYQLSHIPTMPFSITASSSACNATLQGLVNNAAETCPFTFWTDVTTVSSYTQVAPASIRSRLGGSEGSVIDQFGGEYEWDNYTVKLHSFRGVQNPTVTLRYGKNITDLTQEENIANTITGICPFWADPEGGEIVTLPEKVVESSTASSYPYKRTVAYDFSTSFEERPTEAQLRAKAQAYVNKSGVGIPEVSIKLSFVHLADTEEYKDIAPLQHVKLCDVIGIEFERYDISTTAKVVKTVYDVLADRYESIEIGSIRSNLATTISDTNASVQGLANSTQINFAKISNEIQADIDNATAWLTDTGGVIRALKNADDEWTDLLCMSLTATATSGNVLRLNSNGIGFSSTGWNGTYTQAWTLDGRLVIGGTNVPSITVYDNQSNIIFKADANAMQWNALNSSMDVNGNITASNVSLEGTLKSSTAYDQYIEISEGTIYGYVLSGGSKVGQSYLYMLPPSDGSFAQIELNTDRFFIGSDRVYIHNGSSYTQGYTGTKNGCQFINGICVG